MTTNVYPFNLIRAIYDDKPDNDTHTDTIYLKGLYEQIEAFTKQEQHVLKLRFEDGLTFQACGEQLGLNIRQARTLYAQTMRKLRTRSRNRHYKAIPQTELENALKANQKLRAENEQLTLSLARLGAAGVDVSALAKLAKIVEPGLLATPIWELNLSSRLGNALFRHGLRTVEDVLDTPSDVIDNLPNIGVKSRTELNARIRERILLPEPFREQSVNPKETARATQ